MPDPVWSSSKQFNEHGLSIIAIHVYPLDSIDYFMWPQNDFRLLSYLCTKVCVSFSSGAWACECRLGCWLMCHVWRDNDFVTLAPRFLATPVLYSVRSFFLKSPILFLISRLHKFGCVNRNFEPSKSKIMAQTHTVDRDFLMLLTFRCFFCFWSPSADLHGNVGVKPQT